MSSLRKSIEDILVQQQAGIEWTAELFSPPPPPPLAGNRRPSELPNLSMLDCGDSEPMLSLVRSLSSTNGATSVFGRCQSPSSTLIRDAENGSRPPSAPLRHRSASVHSNAPSNNIAIDPNDIAVGTPPPIIPRRTSSRDHR